MTALTLEKEQIDVKLKVSKVALYGNSQQFSGYPEISAH